MKKALCILLSLTMALSLFTGCNSSTAGSSQSNDSSNSSAAASSGEEDTTVYTLVQGYGYSDDHPIGAGYVKMKEELYERSNGRIILELYPNKQLGNEATRLANMETGAVDLGDCGAGELAKVVSALNIFEAPYLFRDLDHLTKFIDSGIMKPYEDEYLAQRDVMIVGYMATGERHFTANFPIDSAADLENVKVRIPNHDIPRYIMQDLFNAAPVPMDKSELYMALKNGTVEAQENTGSSIYADKLYEVNSTISLTGHQFPVLTFCISNKTFQKLPADLQKILLDCIHEMLISTSEALIEANNNDIIKMEEEGTIIHTPSDPESFKEHVPELIAKLEESGYFPEGLYDEIAAIK